jgi:FixH protein
MNWGYKLLLTFVVFAAGIFYLVFRSMNINTELVSKEYYKDELKYQQVIDGSKKANQLSSEVSVSQHGNFIMVKMPQEMKVGNVSGSIWFYCAADEKKDQHVVINLDADAVQQIDKKGFQPGNYTLKIDWNDNKDHYYSEQPLTIL